MAALAADTEAAAGGGRVVEKVFAPLLRGDGGGSQPHALRLLSPAWTAATRRPAGEILRWAATQPRRTSQPFASGTAAHFIEADSLSLLVWHIFNILGGSLAAPRLLPTGTQPAASFCPQHGILRCFLGFA